jgi:hypothetical protein
MLWFLADRVSDRKLRLFACNCLRRVWHLLTDERSRDAVAMAERYADGEVVGEGIRATRRAAMVPVRAIRRAVADSTTVGAAWAALLCINPAYSCSEAALVSATVAEADLTRRNGCQAERQPLLAVLRDSFGPLPFRTVPLDPSWLAWNNGAVQGLARAIYEERRFEEMPVLADALEEAGCTNAEILNHCRQPGEHVRGCWVLDLLLGKQ